MGISKTRKPLDVEAVRTQEEVCRRRNSEKSLISE
jgi:hypothetical protein